MRLFEVKAGLRVRIRSRHVRYLVRKGVSVDIAHSATFEGTVTNEFVELDGANRRLLIDLSIDFWKGFGVWQSDCECEVVN